MARKPKSPKQVESLTHDEASRKNIPTAELQSIARIDQRGQILKPFGAWSSRWAKRLSDNAAGAFNE